MGFFQIDIAEMRTMEGKLSLFADIDRTSMFAFAESFNGKFRTECLNANWFMSLDDARSKCEAWRRDYHEVRPHSAIGNKVPIRLHLPAGNPGQPAVR
jgi:putative transposase